MKGFKKIFEGEVVHDSGFGISFERNRIKYWENNDVLYIPYESILEPYKIVVYTYKIQKDEKDSIIKNIDSALDFLKIQHEFNNMKY
jgi:hypothetical protein